MRKIILPNNNGKLNTYVYLVSHTQLHDAMLVRQLIEQLKQFDADICLVDYEMQRDYNNEVVKERERI